jgi:hypothetical protein
VLSTNFRYLRVLVVVRQHNTAPALHRTGQENPASIDLYPERASTNGELEDRQVTQDAFAGPGVPQWCRVPLATVTNAVHIILAHICDS